MQPTAAPSTERPIADAEVAVPALRLRTRSDSMGVFTLRGVTAGRHVVVVRAIGYGDLSMPVLFRRGETLTIDVLLTASAQRLSPVNVVAPKASGNSPRIAEFDERRKFGLGKFLTQEDFAQAEGRKMLDALTSRIPGVRIARGILVSGRGVISFSRSQCLIRVIFDGIPDGALLDLLVALVGRSRAVLLLPRRSFSLRTPQTCRTTRVIAFPVYPTLVPV